MQNKGRKVGPFSHKDSASHAAVYWHNQGYRVVGPRKTQDGYFLYIRKL